MSQSGALTTVLAREMENAEMRWVFLKTYVEPLIKIASNDDTAMGFLPNHEFLIRTPATAIAVVKCRKVAHSWGVAAKCYARAATEPRSTSIIVSYDEDEAREKLNFLDWIHKAVTDHNPSLLRELRMSDGSEIRTLANGARIRFLARKEPTGPGASVEMDEFSVEPPGRVSAARMLIGALGCTTHTGSVSIGGTQRGEETLFNQIVSGNIGKRMRDDPAMEGKFKGRVARTWTVGHFPWWTSPALCTKPLAAGNGAPLGKMWHGGAWDMETEERVDRFANDKLFDKFIEYTSTPELGLELFQREFEMRILDDKESYFEDELLNYAEDVAKRQLEHGGYYFKSINIDGNRYDDFGDCLRPAKALIEQLVMKFPPGSARGEFGWAMDVGADRDPDEIWIGHTDPRDKTLLLPRLNISMRKMPFAGKEELCHFLVQKVRPMRGAIDATKGSMGMSLGQMMEKRYGQRAAQVQFTSLTKTDMAVGMKSRMEAGKLALPDYKTLRAQIKRVKREEKGNTVRFDAARNATDHADKFWSMAMLCELFSQPARFQPRPPVAMRQNRARGSATSYGGRR